MWSEYGWIVVGNLAAWTLLFLALLRVETKISGRKRDRQ